MDPRHRKSTKPNMSCKHCLTSLISWSNVSCFLGGNGHSRACKRGVHLHDMFFFTVLFLLGLMTIWQRWRTAGLHRIKHVGPISPHPNSQNQLNNSTKESKVVIPIGWVAPSKWKGWPTTKTPWLTNTYWISLFVSLDSLSQSLKEIP